MSLAMPLASVHSPVPPRDGVALSQGGGGPRDADAPSRLIPPVSEGARVADLRLPARRDQPVGPPPAFAVSLLQHLMETARAPAPIIAPEARDPGTGADDPAAAVDGAAMDRGSSEDEPGGATPALRLSEWDAAAASDRPAPALVDLKI